MAIPDRDVQAARDVALLEFLRVLGPKATGSAAAGDRALSLTLCGRIPPNFWRTSINRVLGSPRARCRNRAGFSGGVFDRRPSDPRGGSDLRVFASNKPRVSSPRTRPRNSLSIFGLGRAGRISPSIHDKNHGCLPHAAGRAFSYGGRASRKPTLPPTPHAALASVSGGFDREGYGVGSAARPTSRGRPHAPSARISGGFSKKSSGHLPADR